MKTQIQLHDVQGHILRNARPSAAHYLALSIVNVERFLKWLQGVQPYLHSEARLREARQREHTRDLPSPYFINLGFSHNGLQKLGLNNALLKRFPLAFQKGMAARAAFIGDAGNDAPEHWQGVWGQSSVHVFVALYFLSDQVAAAQRDAKLSPQDQLNQLLVELAISNPLSSGALVLASESAQPIRQDGMSVEHFGFRDGISQPYVNDGLEPHAGAGKKRSSKENWEPLAAGEFLLGYPDELSLLTQAGDQDVAPRGDTPLPLPTDPAERAWFTLTMNGSFLVYRKIQQYVTAFREKIVNEYGAETVSLMVGRRPNGSPLNASSTATKAPDNNEFDFSDDKAGAKCPMQSHIRRANPRTALDTTGQGSTRMVDQHRLIRRGMPYGAWLEEGKPDDGVERGLHFLCYNANIETQFEFVQRNWISNSDFIGCPAATVDPLVGNPIHAPHNPFWAPSLELPLMELPPITRVRGGEYFFMPGLAGIITIIELAKPAPSEAELLPTDTAPVTDPFDAARILGLAQLAKGIRYTTMPVTLANGETRTFHYFADPNDVKTIMTQPALFGNQHYKRRIDALTGRDMLLSMSPSKQRADLKDAMKLKLLPTDINGAAINNDLAVKAAIGPALRQQLGVFAAKGYIDLVEGLARQMPLAILKNYLGISVPTTFPSPTEIASFYDRTSVAELPAEWLTGYENNLKRFDTKPSGDNTLLFWVRMLFLEVFGNLWNVPHITTLATAAAKEFYAHLRQCVDAAFTQTGDTTVLQRLVNFYKSQTDLTVEEQKSETQQRLLEFAVGSTDTTMKAIANTVSTLLKLAPTLEDALTGILLSRNDASLIQAVMGYRSGNAAMEPVVNQFLDGVIMGILRKVPVAPILVRDCVYGATVKLASERFIDIAPGSTVVTVLQAASFVAEKEAAKMAAASPQTGSAPAANAATALPDYVFLDPWSPHGCMGKPIALLQVREVLKGLLMLKNVRAAAGDKGTMIEKYRLPAYQLLRCN